MTMYSPIELREMSEHLLDIARRIGPEGEGMDIDEDFSLDELVQLRSFLSSTRIAIDMVNGGLARYWEATFPNQRHQAETGYWYVGKEKKKIIVDDEMFLGWLATKDAEELGKLFTPSRLADVVKVGGMTPAERDTHLREEYSQTSGTRIIFREER